MRVRSELWRAAIVISLTLIVVPTRGGQQEEGGVVVARAASAPAEETKDGSGEACWVFTHMNKAGGTTVKRLLRPSLDENGIKYGLFDNEQWKKGVDYLKTDYLGRNNRLVWGGYTEGLRPFGMSKCKWFTVFRHPVERLVSAFFYCKNAPQDALCGTAALPAEGADLLTFAKHWSNFGTRQFILGYVLPEAILTSPLAEREPHHPAWYLIKRYLDGPRNPQGTIIPDLAIRHLLEPAETLLSDNYAAVGILDRWDTTMELFNAALDFPKFNWTAEYEAQGSHNKNEDEAHRVEKEAMEDAMTNIKLKRFLRLDLILYEQAVAVHERQLGEHGLKNLLENPVVRL